MTLDGVILASEGNEANHPYGSWEKKREGILCSSISVGNKPK